MTPLKLIAHWPGIPCLCDLINGRELPFLPEAGGMDARASTRESKELEPPAKGTRRDSELRMLI